MSKFQYQVPLLHPDGSQETAVITGLEDDARDGIEIQLNSEHGFHAKSFSERSVFDAVKNIRLQLEQASIFLLCFAADEAVYPSPMQETMGFNCLAYRNRLGRQALSSDIVNIFESDPSITPVSVEEQHQFHQRWLESL